jgi:HK97 gp10 family phage protein
MEVNFELEGLPELAQRLDSIATIVAGPIAKQGLAAGGEVIADAARRNIHNVTGLLADDVVIVVRVHQEAGESFALIGPGWDQEKFTRTKQRRGRWANEAPAPDQTTNPGLYGKFVETGHRDAGEGLAHNPEYQRARRAAAKAGEKVNTAEFGNLSTPPNPWLGPAFEAKKDEAMEVIAESIRAQLESLNL